MNAYLVFVSWAKADSKRSSTQSVGPTGSPFIYSNNTLWTHKSLPKSAPLSSLCLRLHGDISNLILLCFWLCCMIFNHVKRSTPEIRRRTLPTWFHPFSASFTLRYPRRGTCTETFVLNWVCKEADKGNGLKIEKLWIRKRSFACA